MPTKLRRHAITETEAIKAALDAAARRWPEDRDRPSRLLGRLIDIGFSEIELELDEKAFARRKALVSVRGSMTGVYGPGYLEELRAEWPE